MLLSESEEEEELSWGAGAATFATYVFGCLGSGVRGGLGAAGACSGASLVEEPLSELEPSSFFDCFCLSRASGHGSSLVRNASFVCFKSFGGSGYTIRVGLAPKGISVCLKFFWTQGSGFKTLLGM